MNLKAIRLLILPIAMLFLFAGCNSNPAVTAEPDQSREILNTALKAWKDGESFNDFSLRTAIVFVEPKWKDGNKLADFELLGDGETNGFDWQCKAKLSLISANGKKTQEKAAYSISTSPKKVIVRNDS